MCTYGEMCTVYIYIYSIYILVRMMCAIKPFISYEVKHDKKHVFKNSGQKDFC